MDKRTFFDNLHKEIAEKYNTNPSIIYFIRNAFWGNHQDQRGMVLHASELYSRYHRDRKNTKVFYQELINFLASCKPEQYEDITRKVGFNG